MVFFGVPLTLYILVALFGSMAGGGELVSRYQDSPVSAVRTAPGLLYIAVNAMAAVGALVIAGLLAADQPGGREPGFVLPTKELLNLVLVAGFGSLAFFRAKLVTLRVGDSDVGVGPSFVLEIILKAADRAVDRERAEPRAKTISEIMASVSFEEAKIVLPSYCFAVMQNVSVEEQQRVALETDALSNAQMPDRVKALNLGLLLLNIVGEKVLRIAVENLQREFTAVGSMLVAIDKEMSKIDFEKAALNLAPLCAEMAEMDEEDRVDFGFQVQKLRGASLSDRTRRYLLGLLLIRAFGYEIVERAITAVGADIRTADQAADRAADQAAGPADDRPPNE
ncbi:MAG: hypothetical protein RLO51_00245 [Thalassobaculum sp.]|uniref:hypothetical protein n=1 Tax=Thalassobaculum sp. TaxID=2022740 RepID=UPI0032F00E1B